MAAFGLFMVGSTRSFGYDAAVTMRRFVLVPSWTTAFDHQHVSNNHPMFSFLEHVVWRMTGSDSEWVMRLLPALFGALAVGLLARAVERAWGVVPAVTAGAALAVHPLFLAAASEPRGYSLVVLCAIASTLLMLDDRPGWAYLVVVTIGIATHLSMLMVVALQFAWSLRQRRDVWRVWMLGSVACASLAYLFMLDEMAFGRGRRFRASFPLDLARDLLGHDYAVVVLLGICVVVAVLSWRPWTTLGAATLLVLVPWLVGPADWYVRFYTWAVVPVAIAVAFTVRRYRWGLVPIAVALTASLAFSFPLSQPELANEVAATLPDGACVGGWSAEATEVYAPDGVRYVGDLESPKGCVELLVIQPDEHVTLVERARAAMGPPQVLPARVKGLLFTAPR